jgi:hypothetical protein
MRLAMAVLCVCALGVAGAFAVDVATRPVAVAEPPQGVDYSKRPWPDKAPGASYTSLPRPMLLGEPGNGPWGEDENWGVVKFTHEEHYSKYQISCQTCHHTNGAGDASKTEDVQRCVACHKESGNEHNPINPAGDEVDVRLGLMGARDTTTNQAGCVTCHSQRGAGPTTCAGCHMPK